jgi:FO synthase subunit 2
MQGGLNPDATINGAFLPYYLKLVKTIKAEFPQLHLHAFSPQEIQFIAQHDNLSYAQVISALQDAGVGSMPGTAAEVLDDQVRRILCPEKTNSADWLEIVSTAHRLGMPTTSTMLSGHIETPEQQIAHFQQLRSLQQTADKHNYPARSPNLSYYPSLVKKPQTLTPPSRAGPTRIKRRPPPHRRRPHLPRQLDC